MHGGRGSHIRLEMLTGGLCLWYNWYKGYTASTNVSALFDIPLGLLHADSGKKPAQHFVDDSSSLQVLSHML